MSVSFLAALPSPDEPTTIAVGAAMGAFVGSTIARLMRATPERRTHWSLEGSYYGTAFVLLAYTISNL
jgi:hypothetical protein